MRSTTGYHVGSEQVHSWAHAWVMQANVLKDHGWKCTQAVLLNIVFRAAARSISITAACRDMPKAPCGNAVLNALEAGLPKTQAVLEQRINRALTGELSRCRKRRSWRIAIDWHLTPYYGRPHQSQNELYVGKRHQGTRHFHAYASACILDHGERYTVALTWVQKNDSQVGILGRLVARIRELGLKIKSVLLDRAFFNTAVVEFLQQNALPFVMPVVYRGRPTKKGRKARGLRWIKLQRAGWYKHTMKNQKREVNVRVCVGYHTKTNRESSKRKLKKLLFACWRVHGSPTEIRELYRKRFGIEASYRQLRQARIYTCTRKPCLRLFFIALALVLRNLWVWIHATRLAEGTRQHRTLHLERLRFRRMLDWIVYEVQRLMHDMTTPYTSAFP